jgi:hypothetical protein
MPADPGSKIARLATDCLVMPAGGTVSVVPIVPALIAVNMPGTALGADRNVLGALRVCGWTTGANGEPLPTDLVTTRAAQHLREAVTATMTP